MDNRSRILVVEDTKIWQDIFGESLLSEGYQVKAARSYTEAKLILDRQSFDVAVVDIRLSDTDTKNKDGMKVLKDIRDAGDPTSIIIVSGHGTVELTRDAFKEFKVLDFLEKGKFEDDEEVFLQLVERGIQEARAIGYGNRSLSKTFLQELTFNRAHLLPGSSQDREELLQEMFKNFWPLSATPPSRSSLIETQEGRNIIQIVGWSRGIGEAIVARLGSRDVIQKESRNYNQHVKTLTQEDISTIKVEPVYKSGLGGLIYILKGAQLEPLQDFTSFYDEADTSSIINAVNNLFQGACANLYSERGIDTIKVDLSSMYQSMIGQVAAYREQELQEEEHYLQQMEDEDRQSYMQSRDQQIHASVNPIEFVEGRRFVFDSPVGVVHGDLRDGNIVVDSRGQTWLLGFYNTGLSDVMLTGVGTADSVSKRARQAGKRNLLHDFSTMEVSIRKTLISVNPEVMAKFDLALCKPKEFGEPLSFQTDSSIPELDKAFKVIIKLRKLASEVVDFEGDMQLYYTELLYQFLHTYLRLPDRTSKERMVTSAATLAAKLDQWH